MLTFVHHKTVERSEITPVPPVGSCSINLRDFRGEQINALKTLLIDADGRRLSDIISN